MPADPLYPAEPGPEPRPEGQFRADLVRYLDALPVSELGSLLSELPRTRPGTLIIELNQRLPDAGKLLPPAGTPGPSEGRRRSLRERIADRRFLRRQPQAGPPDIVDRQRWPAGIPSPRGVDPTTRRWLQGSLRGRAGELNRPTDRPSPRVLGEAESVPDSFVMAFCDQAVKRFQDGIAGVEGRNQVREEQAQLLVVDALAGEFQQSARSREWTVAERRVRQLAGDAIGLYLEYQHDHGYQPEGARWAAVRECLEGEQARELIGQQELERGRWPTRIPAAHLTPSAPMSRAPPSGTMTTTAGTTSRPLGTSSPPATSAA